jgi:transmembrane sensor
MDNNKELFTGLHIKKDVIPEIATIKHNIDALLNKRAKRVLMYKLTAIAASVLLMLGVFIAFNTQVDESTAYAVTKEVILPDGSKVLLNAHSTLHYKKHWNSWKEREVWIDGEAFFTVTKKPDGYHPKFVVHANGLDVAVVGTEFNVYSRRNKVDVLLEKGKVIATGTGNTKGVCTMHPGQLLVMDEKGLHLSDVKNSVVYTAWKQHRLYFTNAPLSEVARVLEDNYGYKISWKNKQRMQDTFTGSCPADNTALLLKAIGVVYNMPVTIKGNTITF